MKTLEAPTILITHLISGVLAFCLFFWVPHVLLGEEGDLDDHLDIRPTFLFSEFNDLYPAVLPYGQISISFPPVAASLEGRDFDNVIAMSNSSVAMHIIVPELGIVLGRFLLRHPQKVDPVSLILSAGDEDDVIAVSIPFSLFTDEDLGRALPALHSLQALEAGASWLTNESLANLSATCSQLSALDLSDTRVTAKGLLRASGVRRQLRAVSVGGISGSAEEFASLVELWPSAEKLYLHNTASDDSVCKAIGTLERVRVVDLSHTEVSDEGVKQLFNAETIEELYLYGTDVELSDEEIVSRLPRLKVLKRSGEVNGDKVGRDIRSLIEKR